MRTWRSVLAGVVTLVLLAWPTGLVAQDGADPMAASYFTLTRGQSSESMDGELEDIDGDGIPELRGQVEVDIPGLTMLHGDGACEGPNLILSQTYDGAVETYWGVILPSSKVSPVPEPLAE